MRLRYPRATGEPFALTLKRRSRLREKLRLLWGRSPPQDLIAVGEAPEALDDLHVPHGILRRVRASQTPEQLDRTALVLQIFAVHEGHVQKGALELRELPVEGVIHGVLGRLLRLAVGGVAAGVAPEHVAGELVQNYHQRQAAPGLLLPVVQVASCGRLVEDLEAVADQAVELRVLREPR